MYPYGKRSWLGAQLDARFGAIAVNWAVQAAAVAELDETFDDDLPGIPPAPRALLSASEDLYLSWAQSMDFDEDSLLIEHYSVYAEQADTFITLGRADRAAPFIDYVAAVAVALQARGLAIPEESLPVAQLDCRYAAALNAYRH